MLSVGAAWRLQPQQRGIRSGCKDVLLRCPVRTRGPLPSHGVLSPGIGCDPRSHSLVGVPSLVARGDKPGPSPYPCELPCGGLPLPLCRCSAVQLALLSSQHAQLLPGSAPRTGLHSLSMESQPLRLHPPAALRASQSQCPHL